jgi:oligosaccharide repeat unit polymerase
MRESYFGVEPFIDWAYLIGLLGYISIWMGKYLFDSFQYTFSMRRFETLLNNNIEERRLIYPLAVFSLVMIGVVITIVSGEGNSLDPRAFFLREGHLRPIINFTLSLVPTVMVFLFLQIIQYKNRHALLLIILLLSASLLLGNRGVTVSTLITWLFYHIVAKRGQVSLFKFFFKLFCLAFLAIYIANIRMGLFDPIYVVMRFAQEIFYGNHLSDTRDFAWILSCWDETYVLGKTYLAGLISFIPRFISEFRGEWAISVYTNRLVGFDSTTHAGLRPGIFGEAFFNFGYLGVVLLGLLLGYFSRQADVHVKRVIEQEGDVIKAYTQTAPLMFVGQLCITAGVWGLYVFILLNLALAAFRTLFLTGRYRPRPHTHPPALR